LRRAPLDGSPVTFTATRQRTATLAICSQSSKRVAREPKMARSFGASLKRRTYWPISNDIWTALGGRGMMRS
jgi:hypothetical protein